MAAAAGRRGKSYYGDWAVVAATMFWGGAELNRKSCGGVGWRVFLFAGWKTD